MYSSPNRYGPSELWIVEPSDGNPTQCFTDREGTGAYMARIAGPFKLSHWERASFDVSWHAPMWVRAGGTVNRPPVD